MGVKFGAYEKNNSIDSEASMSAVSVACTVSAFIMHSIITLVQPLFFKGHGSCLLVG
jgi:hypothetical protein